MRPTSVKFLAEACGGKLLGNTANTVCDVRIDSRELHSGEMFVAVVGDKNDGHNYLQGAYDLGCRVFLVSEEDKALTLLEKDPQVTLICAPDTAVAFKDMAKAYLEQFNVKKVAVTGSVGKTTTRILTAAVLSEKYKVVSAKKNLNTYLGIAMTAFLADETTEIVVFEMGMDRRHEIETYCDWVFPNTAVITNIGISHLEYLGTRDEIALEKLSITKPLKSDEYLVYQCDGDYLRDDAEMRKFAMGRDFKSFRVGDCGELSVTNVVDNVEQGIEFDLNYDGRTQHCMLPIMGVHNAINASLAAAVGLVYGVSLEEAAAGFAKVESTYRRLDIQVRGGVTIIDDTYNASPLSVIAALDFFKKYNAKRKIVVLGIMRELGSETVKGHLQVGEYLATCGFDLLITIGEEGKYYVEKAKDDKNLQIVSFEQPSMAEQFIYGQVKPSDAVLLKGSNITGVAEIAARMRQRYGKEE